MKFINEYRDKELSGKLSRKIQEVGKSIDRNINLMEVCGTHTTSIFRSGIRSIIPENISLLSGPGCPVCVTPNRYLDRAIATSKLPDVIIATFGDMIKVPGSSSSLEKEKSEGNDIRITYSPLESLRIAGENPGKKVVFLGVGFETTAPLIASLIKTASEENVANLYVLSGHKLIPPAMEALLQFENTSIDGFICPGHVSTIIGSQPYEPLVEEYGIPSVITGFEPADILEGILMLLNQIAGKSAHSVEIQYRRAVSKEGNRKAVALMDEVFEPVDTEWRGLGIIPESGLKIAHEFKDHDAEKKIRVEVEPTKEHPGCICGEVLRGVRTPRQCSLFADVCTPDNPVGPCMVSSEGSCAAYYNYGRE